MKGWSLRVAAIAIACCGCSQVRKVGRDERFVLASDPAVRFEGRWDRSDPGHPRASWPGFAIATDFSGHSISVRLQDAGNYYNVFVDGALHAVVGGEPGPLVTYALASGLPDGTHRVRLQRRNISFDTPTTFEGFVVDKAARLSCPADEKKRRIEFIGDSFTVAEGNEATAPTLAWKAKYPVTNFDLGYASLVAKGLDAEMTAVCRSGSGLVCDFTGDRNRPMPERYGWALMESPKAAWDFSGPPPDLVVIALGLNDHSGLADASGEVSEARSAEFRAAYHRMIGIVRQRYPQTKIVTLASYIPWCRENIHRIVTEEQPNPVYYAEFDKFPDGYVADGHPTVETHRKMAAQVLARLKELGLDR
jgi:lysophospholipase L1-like esterase